MQKNDEKHAGHECNCQTCPFNAFLHRKTMEKSPRGLQKNTFRVNEPLVFESLSFRLINIIFCLNYSLNSLFFLKAIAHHWVVILNINIQMKDYV